jgi:hypothetical protein
VEVLEVATHCRQDATDGVRATSCAAGAEEEFNVEGVELMGVLGGEHLPKPRQFAVVVVSGQDGLAVHLQCVQIEVGGGADVPWNGDAGLARVKGAGRI